jgi:hypothetical protein
MILIASGAYVNAELQNEFGNIPPSFLPLQNKRLYNWQIELFDKSEKIFLSLPESFNIPHHDLIFFEANHIQIIKIPENNNLGMSIVFALNFISNYSESLKLLLGDTLYGDLPQESDLILIDQIKDNYNWAKAINSLTCSDHILSGYFAFSNQSILIKNIIKNNFIFEKGLHGYSKEIEIREEFGNQWLDFGHVNTYFNSKSLFTTQRSFNNLKIDKNFVIKSSAQKNKIKGEISWFRALPPNLKHYAPALLDWNVDDKNVFYKIEYLYLCTLSEMFVFGENEIFVWKNIINSCNEFINDCNSESIVKVKASTYFKSISDKTVNRLTEYKTKFPLDLDKSWVLNEQNLPSINSIILEINSVLKGDQFLTKSFIHGDFCFSNLLYDFRKKSIKVIDPRGVNFENQLDNEGSVVYDITKLGHSMIGLYDFIIIGEFVYQEISPYRISFKIPISKNKLEISKLFFELDFERYNISIREIYALMIHLFLSMLPLHSDKPQRQKAFIANALRLYTEFKKL